MESSLNWDDHYLFLNVAKHGSIRKAAHAIGISHATVSRRLAAFEASMGVKLLERKGIRYVRTPAGDDVFQTALETDELFTALHLRIAGKDTKLEGTIRVTFSEIFMSLLAPDLADFAALNPGIELQVLSGQQALNLSQRDADVALRVAANPPENLVGRRFGEFLYSVYASKDYLQRTGVQPLREHSWVAWDDSLTDFAPTNWIRQNIPTDRIVARANTPKSMNELVASGIGVGQVGCLLAKDEPRLVRLPDAEFHSAGGVWLLTHPELRQTARIRAFLDFLGERLVDHKLLYEPEPVQI
jgi:DNA-binding transcriptional LysR family regulator